MFAMSTLDANPKLHTNNKYMCMLQCVCVCVWPCPVLKMVHISQHWVAPQAQHVLYIYIYVCTSTFYCLCQVCERGRKCKETVYIQNGGNWDCCLQAVTRGMAEIVYITVAAFIQLIQCWSNVLANLSSWDCRKMAEVYWKWDNLEVISAASALNVVKVVGIYRIKNIRKLRSSFTDPIRRPLMSWHLLNTVISL